MKESLRTIIEALVQDKANIQIEEKESKSGIVFEVKVAERRYGPCNWKRRQNC